MITLYSLGVLVYFAVILNKVWRPSYGIMSKADVAADILSCIFWPMSIGFIISFKLRDRLYRQKIRMVG